MIFCSDPFVLCFIEFQIFPKPKNKFTLPIISNRTIKEILCKFSIYIRGFVLLCEIWVANMNFLFLIEKTVPNVRKSY